MQEPDDHWNSRSSFFSRQQERALRSADSAGRWLDAKRADSAPVDTFVAFYERDRDVFGWVLGSAIAFRVFLFLVPLTLLLLGGLTIVTGGTGVSDDVARQAGITGAMAVEVEEALEGSRRTGWILIATGLFGTFWAGRSVTKVLSAVAVRAWDLDGRAARTSVRRVMIVILVFSLILATGILFTRLREASGVGHAVSTMGVFLVYGTVWWVVSLTLPRGTRDPGAALPGALMVGLVMAGLQALTQLLLVNRIETRSQVLGALGAVAVSLGWLFFIGRVMVLSLVTNAVIFERFGSISGLVFSFPGLRRLRDRSPSVRRFFDLEAGDGDADTEPPLGGGAGGEDAGAPTGGEDPVDAVPVEDGGSDALRTPGGPERGFEA